MTKSVLIAVPTYETITPDTFKSLWDMECPDDVDLYFDFVRGYTVEMARNKIVEKAREYGVDYVFMVDNDIMVPSNALVDLISHDKPIVFGVYLHRDPDNPDCQKTQLCKTGQFHYREQFDTNDVLYAFNENITLLRIKGGGLGCALVKMSVFDMIRKPYFCWRTYNKGTTLSEDLHFCEMCHEAGIEIFADPRVQCKHLMRSFKGIE